MLSCSDVPRRTEPRGPVEGQPILVRLLAGLARECSTMGGDIARTGEALSPAATSMSNKRIVEMQSFDALAQTAHALANLLDNASRLAATSDVELVAAIAPLIDAVPLPLVRDRLRGALGVACDRRTAREADEPLFWRD